MHQFDEVVVESVQVFHQEIVDSGDAVRVLWNAAAATTTQVRRRLETTAILTVILRTTHRGCYTPKQLNQEFASLTQEYDVDIIKELRLVGQRYTFFAGVDGIGVEYLEGLDGLVGNVLESDGGEDAGSGSGKLGSEYHTTYMHYTSCC